MWYSAHARVCSVTELSPPVPSRMLCAQVDSKQPFFVTAKGFCTLTSGDVRASVSKYIFRETLHYQLLLFVEEVNLALGWCTMFVSRCLPTVHEWWQSAFRRRRTGVPLFMVSQNGCRTLPALTAQEAAVVVDCVWAAFDLPCVHVRCSFRLLMQGTASRTSARVAWGISGHLSTDSLFAMLNEWGSCWWRRRETLTKISNPYRVGCFQSRVGVSGCSQKMEMVLQNRCETAGTWFLNRVQISTAL